ncbi:MAG: OmpP1/FadL family transporter [Candidatus Aminicenantales bacterium]
MKKVFIGGAILLVLSLGGQPLTGAGFLIYEHGAAAMALAGAFVALANNPSAVFHNPAGLAFLPGTQVSLGTTLIIPKGSLELAAFPDPRFKSVDQASQVFYPSTFYFSHKVGEKVSVGFGFFSPYGLGAEWPKDYPLRYIAVKDDLKTFFFNPAVAVEVSKNFAVGFGFAYVHSTLSFDLVQLADLSFINPLFGSYDVPVNLKATGNGYGFNAGALYRGEKVSLGANWRSGFKIDYEGDLTLDWSNAPSMVQPLLPKAGTASTSFSYPHILGFGLAITPSPNFLLSADVHYILWSSYDEFTVKVDVPNFADKHVEENWKDAFTLRGGVEFRPTEKLALRAGLLYDQTPQPIETMDPILPDANRVAFTGGFGFKTGHLVLDFAYQYEIFSERASPNRSIYPFGLGEGTYKTKAQLIGLSLTFVF